MVFFPITLSFALSLVLGSGFSLDCLTAKQGCRFGHSRTGQGMYRVRTQLCSLCYHQSYSRKPAFWRLSFPWLPLFPSACCFSLIYGHFTTLLFCSHPDLSHYRCFVLAFLSWVEDSFVLNSFLNVALLLLITIFTILKTTFLVLIISNNCWIQLAILTS